MDIRWRLSDNSELTQAVMATMFRLLKNLPPDSGPLVEHEALVRRRHWYNERKETKVKLALFSAVASSLIVLSSFGASPIYGELDSIDPVIHVRDENGTVRTYQISDQIKMAYVMDEGVAFSVAGSMSRCPPYLGDLAEEFAFSVKDGESGQTRTFQVLKSSDRERARVFGECGNDENILNEVTIEGVINP